MVPIALIFKDTAAETTGVEISQVPKIKIKPAKTGASDRMPLLDRKGDVGGLPKVPFTHALNKDAEAQLPQAIAHRGYKAVFPENTMAAFEAAVKVGAHAIETDLHLSKDGVVVLSHDGTLKRCFGIDRKINECDWSYLSTLRTLAKPREPMPRLSDLLEYLATPDASHMWILLDVKVDDEPEELLSRTRQTIMDAKLAKSADGKDTAWENRIVFGGWNETYISLITRLLPRFGAAYIGFNIPYARRFLAVPNVGFNMFQKALVGPFGSKFIKDVQAAKRPLYVWTVDEEEWMEWSIRKGADGVISDDPKLFLEVCERYRQEEEEEENGEGVVDEEVGTDEGVVALGKKRARRRRPGVRRMVRLYAEVVWINFLALTLGWFLLRWNGARRRKALR